MDSGHVLAGRYELVERLGRGGMGEVWAARDRDLRRDVALKLLDREGAAHPELPRRFAREAVAAAQISHPNVAARRSTRPVRLPQMSGTVGHRERQAGSLPIRQRVREGGWAWVK